MAQMPPPSVVFVYSLPMSDLRALQLLRNNIGALLAARRQSQTELAFWMRRDKSWINKFLNGAREIQLKDLDRIADFFGLATYQLFQPGVSQVTERRAGRERRSGHDRRISHVQHVLRALDGSARPVEKETPHDAPSTRTAAALRSLIAEFDTRLDHLLSAADIGRQTPPTRPIVPKPRPRHRTAGGSDAPKSEIG